MKTYIYPFVFGLLLSLNASVQAIPAQTIQIQAGELFAVGPNKPMQSLANALKRDNQSILFRVNWSDFSSASSCMATVLYDRKTGTVKHYASGCHKIREEPERWEAKQEATIYSGVNDQIIQRLARKNRDVSQYSDTDAFFSELIQFGCKKRRLRSKVRYLTP